MFSGAITRYIDVAQVALYVFWFFFAALIWYLRREDKREGYPLESERSPHIRVQGFPAVPRPKIFLTEHGPVTRGAEAPDTRELAAQPLAPWPGAPLVPTGNPMIDAIGPASYANRADVPELTAEGAPRLQPLRLATTFAVDHRDPDPRGMNVVAADGRVGGVVTDVWVDCAEPQVRYLEVMVPGGSGNVLLPIGFARIDGSNRRVKVRSIMSGQFAAVPRTAKPDVLTTLEEDRICAYYAGGTLYADPARAEPLI